MRHFHCIAATGEGVSFNQLDAAHVARFKLQGQFVLTLFQFALAGEFHGGFVRSKGAADQACLSDINACFAFVEQHKRLFVVLDVAKFDEFRTHQAATFCVKAELQNIGADFNALTRC